MIGFRILENFERNLGETSGNDMPVYYGLEARKYLMTHNFVNCLKHETKFNFLFMEFVNSKY